MVRFYPTPSDVKCYINGIELDDVFRIDLKRQVNHQPVYGYNDAKFGFVAEGKELVTGQIVINFRYPGYLTAAIHNAAKTAALIDDVFNEKFDPTRLIMNVTPTFYSIKHRFVEGKPLLDDSVMEGMTDGEKMKFIANALKEHRGSNQTIVDRLKQTFDQRFYAETENVLARATVFDSPLDRGSDIHAFDMTIKYGNHEKDGGFTRVLRHCVLVGESSTYSAAAGAGNDMSSSAQPIFEVYPFFAKTIDVIDRGARDISTEVREVRRKLKNGTR